MDFGEEDSTANAPLNIASKVERTASFGNSTIDYQTLTVHISQRETLDGEGKPTVKTVSSVANVKKLRETLIKHLNEAPCFIIHYGTYALDFESMMVLGQSVFANSKGEIPVAFYAPEAKGKHIIVPDDVPALVLDGCSIFYHIENPLGLEELCKQFDRTVSFALAEKTDLSNFRLIVVIDRTGCFALGSAIRTEIEDQNAFRDINNSDMMTKYLPQVEIMHEVESNLIAKEWETKMNTHMFRGAFVPPTLTGKAKFPLDHLAFIMAFHPFGSSYALAAPLLPDKGMQVKRLLEAWVNFTLGSPVRFITSS